MARPLKVRSFGLKIAENSIDIGAIAASALKAEQARMRVIAENIANSDSTASTPGGDPYRRQIPIFTPTEGGGVEMRGVRMDNAPFGREYKPGNPAADKSGYVLLPNVNGLVEGLDMKMAMRAYEANLNVIENQDAMDKRTLDIIKR
jgi:flagellar basal-body rod protein FlgC